MEKEAYHEGLKNIEFHLANSAVIAAEANSTFSILLTAALGGVGYTANLIEKQAPESVWFAVGATSVHLMIVCAFIVWNCLSTEAVMPPTNEPSNLRQEGYTWEEILVVENLNLQSRIDFNQARNLRKGKWLNTLRFWAFASPVTFAVVWLIVEQG